MPVNVENDGRSKDTEKSRFCVKKKLWENERDSRRGGGGGGGEDKGHHSSSHLYSFRGKNTQVTLVILTESSN